MDACLLGALECDRECFLVPAQRAQRTTFVDRRPRCVSPRTGCDGELTRHVELLQTLLDLAERAQRAAQGVARMTLDHTILDFTRERDRLLAHAHRLRVPP